MKMCGKYTVLLNIVILLSLVEAKQNQVENKENSEVKEEKDDFLQLKPLEKRTFGKFAEKFLVPLLLGALIKVAAIIPVVAIIATFISTVSLIGSKISLLISLVLGIRAILSLIPSEPKEPPALTYDDILDLQHLLVKNHDLNHPQYVDPHHYPYSPPAAMEGWQYNNPHNHVDEHARVAGAHVVNNLERSSVQNFNVKNLAAAEMANKAKAILKQQAIENPKGKIGVKITKTVLKHTG